VRFDVMKGLVMGGQAHCRLVAHQNATDDRVVQRNSLK